MPDIVEVLIEEALAEAVAGIGEEVVDGTAVDRGEQPIHLDAEMARRRQGWTAPALKATSGVLGKYVRLVKSASEGCVTD